MKTSSTLVIAACAFAAAAVGASVSASASSPSPPAQVSPRRMMLFLLIGQSNMAGRGVVEDEDRVVHPRVFMLNQDRVWVPAVDPVHFDKPKLAGVGLASTFGRVVAERRPTAVVGLVPAAFGGTTLDQWAPGGELYTTAVERTREAMKSGTLAGILWHQGEGDSDPELARTYPDRFARMIAQLRRDLDAPEVPVVVGGSAAT